VIRRVHLVIAAALSLALSAAVAAQAWVVGSVAGRSHYDYVRPFAFRSLLVAAGLSIAAVLLLKVRASGRRLWLLLLAWILFATAAHAAMHAIAPWTVEELYVSPHANSFYSLTQETTPSDVLGRFNSVRRQAPLHARSNMPGKTLLTFALAALSSSTAVLPWLLIALSNFGALLMFGLARELLDDPRAALYAAVLYLFVPCRVFFFPLMNSVTPVMILGCAWLLLRWLRTGRTPLAVAFGVALYALVFFEPLPLVTGLLFAALAAAAIYRGSISVERFVLQACLALLTFIATSEVVYLTTGFQLLAAFRQIGAHAVDFNVLESRPYGVWIRANLGELLFGLGIAPALLFFIPAWVEAGRAAEWRGWIARPVVVFTAGLTAVVVATDLLGLNRGEVIRLWIFLACLAQIPAACACARTSGIGAIATVLVLGILHTTVATAMIQFVLP
jgi:hypothetical protein